MNSPFKFLDAYDLEDQDIFFGRDEEIAKLYDMVNKNRLILVYGQSGTGKTSLVRCGLASRFDVTDWYALLIRRRGNINDSLAQAIRKPLGGELLDTFAESIEELYALYLRPVYLIFDQLEEIFTARDNEEEQQLFIQTIAEINAANLPCRILFILREEYLGHLYNFEKVIPTLFDRRLRVEPMTYNNVSAVITKSCEKFNISLPTPETAVRKIIDGISDRKSGIQLPYLQVYLDMFYREDYARTYPKGTAQELPPLTFELEEIKNFGAIGNVMKKFLDEQQARINGVLRQRYKNMPEDAVQRVLDSFVTLEGTKRSIGYHMDGERLVLERKMNKKIGALHKGMLPEILQQLERSRILRKDDDSFELAHDSLAALIDQQRSGEQRQLNEVRLRLQNIYKEHTTTGVFLNEKQLKDVDEVLAQLEIEAPVAQFVEDSRKQVKATARRKRNTRLAILGSILAFGIVMGISAWSTLRYSEQVEQALEALKASQAQQEQTQKEKQLADFTNYVNQGKSKMELGEYELAVAQFEVAIDLAPTPEEATRIKEGELETSKQLAIQKVQFDSLMTAGNLAIEENQLVAAINAFRQAEGMVSDVTNERRVKNRLEEVRVKMLPSFRQSVERAYIFYEAEDCVLAQQILVQARRLQPYLRKANIPRELDKIATVQKECAAATSKLID